jgi:hypothetical protein
VLTGRTATYLNWRFGDNPWHDYDLFVIERGSETFGYLALKVFRDPATGAAFGDVVDLLWREDDVDALSEVLRFALHHFHECGVSTAATWLQTGTVLDDAGREAGFRETEQKRTLCCRVLDGSGANLAEPLQWFFTMVDAESFY